MNQRHSLKILFHNNSEKHGTTAQRLKRVFFFTWLNQPLVLSCEQNALLNFKFFFVLSFFLFGNLWFRWYCCQIFSWVSRMLIVPFRNYEANFSHFNLTRKWKRTPSMEKIVPSYITPRPFLYLRAYPVRHVWTLKISANTGTTATCANMQYKSFSVEKENQLRGRNKRWLIA